MKLRENANPVFAKSRKIAHALLPKVQEEFEKLVKEGILRKVQHSEWATPIVPVRKANGRIRICGDFKITINPCLVVDQHPLPTIDELFSTLSGVLSFRNSTYEKRTSNSK